MNREPRSLYNRVFGPKILKNNESFEGKDKSKAVLTMKPL